LLGINDDNPSLASLSPVRKSPVKPQEATRPTTDLCDSKMHVQFSTLHTNILFEKYFSTSKASQQLTNQREYL